MKYKVKLRKVDYLPHNQGSHVADLYRVEWLGLKTTLVARSISASRVVYEEAIREDYIRGAGGIPYDFHSTTGKREDSTIIKH